MKSSTIKLFFILLVLLSLNQDTTASTPKTAKNELNCLTEAMYHEARGEGRTGQEAVALVTLNRVKHPSFPKSVCGVVYQRGQYSWTRKRQVVSDKKSYERIRLLATSFYNDFHAGKINENLSGIRSALYFNRSTVTRGGKRTRKVGQIGRHAFYRG